MSKSSGIETSAAGSSSGQLGWMRTITIALIVLIAYRGTTYLTGRTDSPQHAYFDYLAQAFLDGKLYLEDPPGHSDLTQFNDRWYVPFPPLAAGLMTPLVATLGIKGMNVVLFSIVCGILNVLLLARILDGAAARGWIELDVRGRAWLLVMFAFGCVHWQVALEGSVWFMSHTCTVTFIMLAIWLAIGTGNPWAAGGALALAIWGRPNVVFTWILLVGIAAQQMRDAMGRIDRKALIGWAAKSTIPLIASIGGLMWYNQARFQNPFDFGYGKQKVSAEVLDDLARGQFHIHHLPRNLHIMLMGGPRWYEPEGLEDTEGADEGAGGEKPWSFPIPNDKGMSIFLTTPALFYLVRARGRRDPLMVSAWLATGVLLIPLLLYYNTGWRQFGYRFSLDFMAPVMLLMAAALGRRADLRVRVLIVLGILINAWGVAWWYTNWLD